jgi:DNA-binding NarL/FixJ family response regulator
VSDEPGPDRPLVLVAEDEPLASMAIRAQLEALDYRVLGPARDGDEAVALGACHPVDVALLDMRMPGRTGLQAALDLFDLAPTPVVLLTGVGASDLPDPLPRPPVFAVLTKPVDLDDIRAALDSALDGFRRWTQETDRHDDGASADERATIARAVSVLAEGGRPATAAARILDRARDEGRTPADVASDILAGAE